MATLIGLLFCEEGGEIREEEDTHTKKKSQVGKGANKKGRKWAGDRGEAED